ncbi:putative peptidyl-tRNA hydrolase 2 [Iris pallida]|uniref:Peptidyl-tRNA hydrolase 2 n=1 Tax=Iris pallida TaxID=29817 RepID=A0AAX6GN40_IRIPA|nr:putative peptidyl-tRNA hydrolase 2 [Iris pallida]
MWRRPRSATSVVCVSKKLGEVTRPFGDEEEAREPPNGFLEQGRQSSGQTLPLWFQNNYVTKTQSSGQTLCSRAEVNFRVIFIPLDRILRSRFCCGIRVFIYGFS